jgi:hypothetical protein
LPEQKKNETKRKFAVCIFLPTPVLFSAKEKELASLKQLFLFNAPKSTSASRQKKEAGPGCFLGGGDNIASLVRVDVFVYVIRIFRTTFSTARLPLFGRLNEITDKKRKTRFNSEYHFTYHQKHPPQTAKRI